MNDMTEILKYTKNLSMLYVEDEKILQTSSLELFDNFFDEITIADDGEQALDLYKNNKYDLIITDIFMPKMDGIELIKHIRELDKKIPIIVFSALNDPSYMTSCVALNVDSYILKPLAIENMLDALQKVAYKLAFTPKEKVQDEKEFKKLFDVDILTKLKSHNALVEDMHNLKSREIPVVILINIDEFHVYNELYGLDIGDEILVKFAQMLKEFSKDLDYELYRMSGDEFIFYEKVIALDPQKYEDLMQGLFEYMELNQIHIDEVEEPISLAITVGISFDSDNSYGRADMALKESRRRGRKYLGFSVESDIRKELQDNLYWREEINRALYQSRVHAYYLPIVDEDKNILKYESLIRIKQIEDDGVVKLISPHEFLDFSKISKQYIGLTKVMINESFNTMIEHNVHVAINLTFHDIENREINKLLHERISNHSTANRTKFDISSQVIFELLEHKNHEDYDTFMNFVSEFKKLGVLITIDNFGMGFANMSKIAALAPNYVKIDSKLIKNIVTDKHAYSLVSAIVKFAKELGIKTIAEHITSESIFKSCIDLGIDEFQGYYFSEPIERIR
ncbi:MAG: hypothetical protein DRG78_05565 [Epsilonproteobacteria bacterium]|nr:MAG: hypothetical protein DRG78_05565 [Campylobacterota bacterium]